MNIKQLLIFAFTFLCAEFIFAGTRIKTVEWSFGGYYNSSDLSAGSYWTPPTITVVLPENSKVIRNAFLEFICLPTGLNAVTDVDVRFNQGSPAVNTRDVITSSYLNPTGENVRISAIADVTNVISTNNSQTYTASVSITGSASNAHTLKLYITYEYDDTSTTQIKTVRFPLHSASNIASRTSEAAENSSYAFTYNAVLADSSVSIQQQWFEIRAIRRWGVQQNINGYLSIDINGGAASSSMYLTCQEEGSFDYRYIDDVSTATPAGFQINTSQTLNISLSNTKSRTTPAHILLGGECVLTYQYSNASAEKTKTVRIFLGQDTTADNGANFTKTLTLAESGVSIKEIYAEILGSYNSDTGSYVVIDSSVNAQTVTQQSYYVRAETPNTAGFIFYHDLGQRKASWTNGCSVGLSIGNLTNLGGCGANLIVTYSYTNEAQYTEFYQAWTGQTASGNLTSTNQTYNVWFPDPSSPIGLKTLRSHFQWLYFTENEDASSSVTTPNPTTTIDINGSNSSPVEHRTQNECHTGYVLYGNQGQITTSSTSGTLNFSISVERTTLSGKYFNTYTYAPPPTIPSSLAQYKSDGTTSLGVGTWTNQTAVKLKFTVSSPLPTDTLTPQVEVRPVGTSFSNTVTHNGTNVNYSGTPATAEVSVSGLTADTQYHWQARVTGNGGSSSWISFGGNPESSSDFGVDVTSPTTPSLTTPLDTALSKTRSMSFSWASVTENHSGIDYYELQVATSSSFTTITVSSCTDLTQASTSYLSEKVYYWKVRAKDNAGNTGTFSSARSFTVDLSSPSIQDDQLGETIWRKNNDGWYNINFTDAGNSLLDKFQVRASTVSLAAGPFVIGWTDTKTAISADSYLDDWQLPTSVWTALHSNATNYISVRAYDKAGNYSDKVDAFTVLKDTIVPTVGNGELGGEKIWRKTSGTVYDVNFQDFGSHLKGAKYEAWTGQNKTVSQKITLTPIPGVGGSSFGTDWSVVFDSLRDEATNYISIEVYDVAGNTSTVTDAFFIWKDTTSPAISNGESGGENIWRKALGTPYDVNFTELGSYLKGAKYEAWTGQNKTGTQKITATPIPNVGGSSYTSDWTVNFNALADETTNYVSIEVYDVAGNTRTVTDAFYVLKDTTPPTITNGESGGDNTWQNALGTVYDVNFLDGGSKLNGAKYEAWTGQNKTDIQKVILTTIPDVTGINFGTDWTVDFDALRDETTNYISIEVYDVAGNTQTLTDAFYVLKDTSPPIIRDYQTGDSVWRNQNIGSYNIDFEDMGCKISKFQVKASTHSGDVGPDLIGWSDVVTSIDSQTYTANWSIPALVWGYLKSAATNYISVRAYDTKNNVSNAKVDAFYILKDEGVPLIRNYQGGDNTWRKTGGTVYNVDFEKTAGAFLASAEYKVHSSAAEGGSTYINWYPIEPYINSLTYTANWPVNFNGLKNGYNYVSVRTWDLAHSTATTIDAFYVKVDTSPPAITNYVSGDNTWRKGSGTAYNVDFYDNLSLLNTLQYTVHSSTNLGGVEIKEWTPFAQNLSAVNYDTNWQVDFGSLKEYATNYVSVRAWDMVGSTRTAKDVFYILIDTTPPSIINYQSGDSTWRKLPGTSYNVDFRDLRSGTTIAQYIAWTGPGQTGTKIFNWQPIYTSTGTWYYGQNWQVDFNNLKEGKSYISVRNVDKAGNVNTLNDAFYVQKDTTPPTVVHADIGDNTWRTSNNGSYNVDFYDTGGSKLTKFQIKITTGPSQTGRMISDWVDRVTDINANSYTANWGLSQALFDAMQTGINYVSVCAYDTAGSTKTKNDVFYVKKDTSTPEIRNYQSGDTAWRTGAGTVYNVDFADPGSLLTGAQYTAWTGQNRTGTEKIIWTNIFTSAGVASYTDNWSVVYNSLAEGLNFISVRAFNVAGTTTTLNDVFYIKKDSISPSVDKTNQSGDTTWRSTEGTAYKVYFQDQTSLLQTAEYTIWTGQGRTDTMRKTWTPIFSSLNQTQYTTDWQVDFSSLAEEVTNYVSVRVWDVAGTTTTSDDVFFVLTDQTKPTVHDYQSGDTNEYPDNPGNIFDVDFKDTGGSKLSRVQYTAWTLQGKTGTEKKPYTDIMLNIGATYYNTNWGVDFGALQEAYNYISVKAIDLAGNTSEYIDAFYVRKAGGLPTVTSDVPGDTEWQTAEGKAYNVDFSSNSPDHCLDYFQTKVCTQKNQTGTMLQDWTTAADTIHAASYTDPWPFHETTWDLLQQGTNYISIRVYNEGGAVTTVNDVFYVLKDTETPTMTNYLLGGVSTWINASQNYNIDFNDPASKISYFEYKVHPAPNEGGAPIKTWTPVESSINKADYTNDWQLDFDILHPATNYVSVRVFDYAGLSSTTIDAFYILKDTSTPGIINAEAGGDMSWRTDNTHLNNISFADTVSKLSYFEVKAASVTGGNGLYLADWTMVDDDINAVSYDTPWAFPAGVWDALLSRTTNYISVRVIDHAGNTSSYIDAFQVLKDTAAPVIRNYQDGDDAWRNVLGTTYQVEFQDIGYGLTTAQYQIWSDPGQTGSLEKTWTPIFSSTRLGEYTQQWTIDFSTLTNGIHYVSVRAFDGTGSSTTVQDVFYVKKDTSPPTYTNHLINGDTTWRNIAGALYNIDFEDPHSLIESIDYTLWTQTGRTGTELKTWTPIASDLSEASYTDDWSVDFSKLQEQATNYVSVRITDHLAQRTTANDIFFILFDKTKPSITNNQSGDYTWRRSSGTVYNVNFGDAGGSNIKILEYCVFSSSNQADNEIIGWTPIENDLNQALYETDWEVDFDALQEGVNYVSVHVQDYALNEESFVDAFSVRKDTTAPIITDTQNGDTTWRNANTATYTVYFEDTGGSKLDRFETKITTGSNQTGILVQDWTAQVSNINNTVYTENWSLLNETWDLLRDGTNYVTVRAYDTAGSSRTKVDAFYVLKSTKAPSINDNQLGETVWRNANTGYYAVYFEKNGAALLDKIQTRAYTGPNETGNLVKDWTDAVTNINAGVYNTNWQVSESFWDLLKQGTNYISVKIIDTSLVSAAKTDAFNILKDTTAPTYTENVGDYTWRKTAGTTYAVNIYDTGNSLLSGFQVRASTMPNNTGPFLANWTPVVSSIKSASYTTPWALPTGMFSVLKENVTNYISIRAWDIAGSTTTLADVFKVFKDTTPPTYTDNQLGDDTWRNTYTAGYNIDFNDTGGSKLINIKTTIYTGTNQTGTLIENWTTQVSNIYAHTYSQNWPLIETTFNKLSETSPNYVSVRGSDTAGSYVEKIDAFYIKKDVTLPTITNGELNGDTAWKKTGRAYNIDFQDTGSQLRTAEYTAWTSPNTTDIELIPWTTVFLNLDSANYTNNWSINFDLLQQGTNYISVRAWDMAGSTRTVTDAFFVRKDTTSPTIDNQQTGDTALRNTNDGSYTVYFADTGGAKLSYFQVKASTVSVEAGPDLISWTTVQQNLNVSQMSASWNIPETVWNALSSWATNYISVRVVDLAGNTSSWIDAFYVKKTTVAPIIQDLQNGDTTWHSIGGTAYNVNFIKNGIANLDEAQYTIWSQEHQSGIERKIWTPIFDNINQPTYTDDWEVDFTACREGYNYVSVKAQDMAGNESAVLEDPFYVKVDTTGPRVIDLQNGDTTWQTTSGKTYNVNFEDFSSGLTTGYYTIYSDQNLGGTQVKTWTPIFSSAETGATYNTDWSVDFTALLHSATNYISVRVYDVVGNSTTVKDIFTVLKDTTAPSAIANLQATSPTLPADEGKLNLSWTEPSQDSVGSIGKVASYVVKYRTGSNFTDQASFDAASSYGQSWSVPDPGTAHNETLTGLTAGVTYYIAIETRDKAGNQSTLSSVTENYHYAGKDLTKPSAITNLTAKIGAYEGELDVTWTAPGDNDTTGTADSYIVKYSLTAISNQTDFNNASTYNQLWEPQPAHYQESKTLLLPQLGTTYYIAIEAVDEALNQALMSNINTNYAKTASASATKGLFLYAESGVAYAKYRPWLPPSWDPIGNTPNAAASIYWIDAEAVPYYRNEMIVGLQTSTNRLYVQKWDGDATTWSTLLSNIGNTANNLYKGFDIACEQNSGRAVVVYYNGATGKVSYRVWSSTASTWAVNETELTLGTMAGAVNWVRLCPRKNSNQIMMGCLSASSNLYVIRWNGTTWDNGSLITTAASDVTRQSFDIAWETNSGECMTAYGTTSGNVSVYLFNGTIWSAGSAYAIGNSNVQWVRIAADPTSNRIGLNVKDADADWNVNIWNGDTNAWMSGAPTEDSRVDAAGSRNMDCVWERTSGKYIATMSDWGEENRINYVYWNGSWSAAALTNAAIHNTTWSGNIQYVSLKSDPNTNNIMLCAIDANEQIKTVNWNPETNLWSGDLAHIDSGGAYEDTECFMIAYEIYDKVPPVIYPYQSGDTVWRSTNTATYNVDFTDTGGSKLSYIQTRITHASGLIQDWANQVINLSTNSYSTNWPLKQSTFDLLKNGTNYVSVRIYDGKLNYATQDDAFYIRKDSTTPTIANGVTGDNTWRNASGTTYNVTFADTGGSRLNNVQYTAWTGQNRTGTEKIAWTNIASNILLNSYATPFTVSFAALAPGTNYISVRAFDVAGGSKTLTDAFYIKKDTVAPSAINSLTAEPGTTQGQVKLTWTAPGDNNTFDNNTSGSYAVKYSSLSQITAGNFDSASTFAQTWTPINAGLTETRVVTGLTPGINYYFAVKTKDKVPNTSTVSNSPNAQAQSGGVYINEIYASGSSADDDWVELYNSRNVAISLNGWKLWYNQGTIATPSTEDSVWTGPDISIPAYGRYIITPSMNLSEGGSKFIKLVDNTSSLVDRVQWPSIAGDKTFARISDANALFEIDPTKTKNYTNAISTETVKINEVSYDTVSTEFIELYESDITRTLTGWKLRNKLGIPFVFTRKILSTSFTFIDSSSSDNSANPYATQFGASGLTASGDFIVLENPSGQVVDRVSWQISGTGVYYNYTASPVYPSGPATSNVASPASIGRYSTDGKDTDIDSSDFTTFTTPSPGVRNSVDTQVASSSILKPSTQALAKNFKIEIDLDQDASTGSTDVLIFSRTGGVQDQYSPHIYQLTSIGFNVTTLTAQTTVQTGVLWNDQDGHPLNGGTIYKMQLYTDTSNGRSLATTLTNILYNATQPKVVITASAMPYMNVNVKDDVLKIIVKPQGIPGSNNLELVQVKARLLDNNAQAFSDNDAKNLFSELYIIRDSTAGIKGTYESAVDQTILGCVDNEDISLDGAGTQIFDVENPDASSAGITASTTQYFFLVTELASNATNYGAFRVALDADAHMSLRDSSSDVMQYVQATSEVTTSSTAANAPPPPPSGWPYEITNTTSVYSGTNITTDGNTIYTGSNSGLLQSMNDDGTSKWSFTPDTVSPIRTTPLVDENNGEKHLYFANAAGELYHVRDDTTTATRMWKRTLAGEVKGTIANTADYLVVGCADGKIYKIDKNTGLDASGWTYDESISGILYEPAIDYTPGVNSTWIGSSNGNVYRVKMNDGTRAASLITGGAVPTPPFVDAGYIWGGSNNLFVPSLDGRLYCRKSGSMGDDIPDGWLGINGEFNAGSPITTWIWMNWEDLVSPFGTLENYLYFGCENGKLYKIDASNGAQIWMYQAGDAIRSGPINWYGYVYFGCDDGNMYCLNEETKAMRTGWPYATGAAIRSMPVIDNDYPTKTYQKLYFTSTDGKTYCLDIAP